MIMVLISASLRSKKAEFFVVFGLIEIVVPACMCTACSNNLALFNNS